MGIDTSSTDLSVCLCTDGSPVSTVCRYVKNSHAEHITQAVKLSLDLGGTDAGQITHIAVSVGPGSFTGLRIGVSFVKGMSLMAERRVLPLSSLMVLAHAAGSHFPDRKIFTALDARQGRIHWGSFVWDGENKKHLRRLTDDRLSPPEELFDELSADDILVTDTMGYSRSTVFDGFVGKAEIIDAEKSTLNRSLSCAALAFANKDEGGAWLTPREITPNYLQMPAATEVCHA